MTRRSPEIDAYIQRTVDAAPPLSAEQRDRLYAIFHPAADGSRPPPAPRPRPTPLPIPTGLYRYFDSEGVLLYVGVTRDDDTRDHWHRSNQVWARFIARREDGAVYVHRAEAMAAEAEAIAAEHPIFNRSQNRSGRSRAIDYLVDHDAYDLITIRGLGGRSGVEAQIAELRRLGAYECLVVEGW